MTIHEIETGVHATMPGTEIKYIKERILFSAKTSYNVRDTKLLNSLLALLLGARDESAKRIIRCAFPVVLNGIAGFIGKSQVKGTGVLAGGKSTEGDFVIPLAANSFAGGGMNAWDDMTGV